MTIEQIVRENVRKLHTEVAQETMSMYIGVFISMLIASLGFLVWQLTQKLIGLELMLAALTSGAGWVVRSEAIIHAPDEYLQLVQDAFVATEDNPNDVSLKQIGTWGNFRKQLKVRMFALVTGDLLAATLVWYMAVRATFDLVPTRGTIIVLNCMLGIGVFLIPITANHASSR